uniref:Uncharacterized protein n=1 Tax=viral metagenome TaxID=1070528 RepID=A0A6C0BNE2_9ZZZZ
MSIRSVLKNLFKRSRSEEQSKPPRRKRKMTPSERQEEVRKIGVGMRLNTQLIKAGLL